jgi:hypothetical protein
MISPHRGRELELLYSGEKPAGILRFGPGDVRSGDIAELGLAGFLLVYDRGDVLVGRTSAALDRLRAALLGLSDPGAALGYTDADIHAFELWFTARAKSGALLT